MGKNVYALQMTSFIRNSIQYPPQVLTKEGRENLTSNIAGHLIGAQEFLQKRAIGNFAQADPMFGRMLQEKIDKLKAGRKVIIHL